MQTTPFSSAPQQDLFQSTVQEAAASGHALMGRLVKALDRDISARSRVARTHYERDALSVQQKLLHSKSDALCTLYPKALLKSFTQPEAGKKGNLLTMAEANFEQLELMDEQQVRDSVAVAHAQQVATLAVESSLAELDTLVCAAQGLSSVRLESNPLRTQAYVNALKSVMAQVDVPAAIQLDWLTRMGAALGPELNAVYQMLSDTLRQHGVVAAGYAVLPTPARAAGVSGLASADQGARRGGAMAPQRARADDPLLTLEKLRRLLAGEFDAPEPGNHVQSFSAQFSREFETGTPSAPAPVSGFDATVPAALEALTEMKQVAQVVQRMEHRRSGQLGASDDSPVEGIRDVLRRSATSVAQTLSLEVVTLMVDNIVRNPRLLEPIQRLIGNLEPGLLLLSLVDPRFFSDKTHPARELLQEITSRSLAYESVDAPGFAEFFADLEKAVEPLGSDSIENADPFEYALRTLRASWHRSALSKQRELEETVRVLERAEQRNLLAAHIAREIEHRPDLPGCPDVVIDFLCGPWAQVVAQARLAEREDKAHQEHMAAEKYYAVIAPMLWSVNPKKTRMHLTKLTQLVPPLLDTLREGLETIHYPPTNTSAFFSDLMDLHQLAFRTADKRSATEAPTVAPPAEAAPLSSAAAVHHPRQPVMEEDNPWVDPAEARASNFMEWTDLPAAADHPSTQEPVPAADPHPEDWPVGSWVELMVNNRWVRTQLTWASPQNTLFLFTSAAGSTQSMTRRSRDKLVQSGLLRVATTQSMVDGALNAVATIAMRNSVDTTY